MKILRILLLVVLSVLLPARGVMALGMSYSQTLEAVATLDDDAHFGHDAGHAGGTGALHAMHDAAPAQSSAADSAGASSPIASDAASEDDPGCQSGDIDHADHKCSHCCDLCAMTPIASVHDSALPEPLVAEASFAIVDAAAPTFAAGGQDRPPRSV